MTHNEIAVLAEKPAQGEISMDKLIERFRALSLGGKIILIAGLVLFIDGFLPWYCVSFEIYSASLSAPAGTHGSRLGAIWSMLAVFIGLAMAAAVGA